MNFEQRDSGELNQAIAKLKFKGSTASQFLNYRPNLPTPQNLNQLSSLNIRLNSVPEREFT
jgi:hypothetical protein